MIITCESCAHQHEAHVTGGVITILWKVKFFEE